MSTTNPYQSDTTASALSSGSKPGSFLKSAGLGAASAAIIPFGFLLIAMDTALRDASNPRLIDSIWLWLIVFSVTAAVGALMGIAVSLARRALLPSNRQKKE